MSLHSGAVAEASPYSGEIVPVVMRLETGRTGQDSSVREAGPVRFTERELTVALEGAAKSVLAVQDKTVRKGRRTADEAWAALTKYQRFQLLDGLGDQLLPVAGLAAGRRGGARDPADVHRRAGACGRRGAAGRRARASSGRCCSRRGSRWCGSRSRRCRPARTRTR